MTFKQKIESYLAIKENDFNYMPDFERLVIDAIEVLGLKEIERLNYHKGDIEKALISKSDLSKSNKIASLLLKNDLTIGTVKTNEELKLILGDIYNKLGIKKAPSATHIKKYFQVVQTKIKMGDKIKNGYKIIKPLTVFV
ncbi:hypothetical protein [Gaoshiqia sediminis]|uniref:Uncharacterized protein n=1 Tax=Gaoshiqia sediminis TaxID=2986998 RepID=A0AA41Y9K2_9BACT|nr:hypothetical protein [Gaoshiqia sediminis]MCW0484674.1 hypothetical protein [Gaoshiqia sediminis]